MKIDDVQDLGSALLIKIPVNKTNKPRSFTVTGDYLNYFRKYSALRPPNVSDRRFFLAYRNGKCCKQVVGIHKFGSIPQEIASYLKLPNAKEYTGHCFRRTSATFLVDAGADITSLKRHGGWKSSDVAEGYIDESLSNKLEVAKKILNASQSNLQTTSVSTQQSDSQTVSAQVSQPVFQSSSAMEMEQNNVITENKTNLNNRLPRPIVIQNCSNCSFNINIVNN